MILRSELLARLKVAETLSEYLQHAELCESMMSKKPCDCGLERLRRVLDLEIPLETG